MRRSELRTDLFDCAYSTVSKFFAAKQRGIHPSIFSHVFPQTVVLLHHWAIKAVFLYYHGIFLTIQFTAVHPTNSTSKLLDVLIFLWMTVTVWLDYYYYYFILFLNKKYHKNQFGNEVQLMAKQRWKTDLQTKWGFIKWDEDYDGLAALSATASERKIFLNIVLTEKSDFNFKSIHRPALSHSHNPKGLWWHSYCVEKKGLEEFQRRKSTFSLFHPWQEEKKTKYGCKRKGKDCCLATAESPRIIYLWHGGRTSGM